MQIFNSEQFISLNGTKEFKINNLADHLPFLKPFYFQWELDFNSTAATDWCLKYYNLAPAVVTVYILFCYFGKLWMRNREEMNLKKPLKYWNLFLTIFSFVGMIRTVPHLLFMIYNYGPVATILVNPDFTYAHGASGLWVLFFLISKYFELIDTAFLILRKKNLNFLHWYHHATVLWYTWDACIVSLPAGIYFVTMNYSVHAVMYLYYYVSAQSKGPLEWGIFVTIAQLTQMFIGVSVTILSFYYSYNIPKLNVPNYMTSIFNISQRNLIAASLMYSTYFYLFAEYFFNRYLRSRNSYKTKKL